MVFLLVYRRSKRAVGLSLGGYRPPLQVHSKLAQIVCPRQDLDDVLPPCRSVAGYGGFFWDAGPFSCGRCAHAADHFFSLSLSPPHRASTSFSTANACRQPALS